MIVNYIEHSGFFLELERHCILFDYFKGEIPECENKEKMVTVFVSHKHHDHFNHKIFDLVHIYPNIRFFISKDAKMNQTYMIKKNIPKEAFDKIQYVRGNEQVKLEGMTIDTLTSTDQGVAFVVTCEDKVIYHAGDLNWWTWEGESEEESKTMEKCFANEIEKITGRSIDVAFLPLDPRQESCYWWGFDYFMRKIDVRYVFPMHCWEDYSIIWKLLTRKESESYRKRIIPITGKGQQFYIQI
ncbi:MBL fold metallo-hydrolase [Velocimicrobium porci]|uniref:MBL fold metallo-hydrolase n=1 Tax=Velocimicrobium porci TaxID=2606634 RepID=A0A6L5XY81_9FIRM|nr:MBL fold metallo-hydrolase [Velocimicrobium porci]MSS63208.1 MBL fold metallo-hydrolase [Velocimicrobium porci]